MSKIGLEVRLVAARLLANVLDKRTSLDGMTDIESGQPAYRALDSRDRALARAIVKAALRHHVALDTLINKVIHKPLTGDGKSIGHHLHVALAQILFLDVPDSAAVDLAVTAVQKDKKLARFGKLTNALLRNIQRMNKADQNAIIDEAIEAPQWFWQRLQKDYGADAKAILKANKSAPALDITVKSNPDNWAEKLGGFTLFQNTVRIPSFECALTALEGFEDGDWWVQDVSASLPATLFSGDLKGKKVLDLCAAPGGKTAQLTAMGAEVTALEINKNRIKRLEQNLARLGLSAELVQEDLRKFEPKSLYDAVLLDAPCSSTGTMRRHPDILWTKTEADIEKLAHLQKDLLKAAGRFIKPDGEIMFSNCSLDMAEGEHMIKALLAEEPTLMVKPIEREGLEKALTKEGYLRITPLHFSHDDIKSTGADGFFAAKLCRT